MPNPDSSPLLSRVEEARRELLDLSLRNPLLSYRAGRARGVEMVGESASQVFDTLVNKGQAMSFVAGLTGDSGTDGNDDVLLQEEVGQTPGVNRVDRRLQTSESPENLKKRLLNTHRLANSTMEETGVNTLFIALGMVRWYEADQSSQLRRAPLILLPVRLERSGVRDAFRVSYSGEDIGSNLSLVEKVRIDFGLVLPSQADIDLDGDGIVDVDDYIALIEDRINQSGLRRWQVDPDSVVLGFFSYNKLLMYLDLDDEAWPSGQRIADNEIFGALFVDGFREEASLISDDEHLDTHLSPRDTYHVLDADSSQSLAIYDAARGRNMVIQGPPGTGKSQTISNIIAETVGRGKRVLFVAEKMAALEVVKRRLDGVDLGILCLELHSHKSNKRETLNDLERTLNLSEPEISAVDRGLDDLSRTRRQLNDYDTALNDPLNPSGITPHDAMGQLLYNNSMSNSNPIPSRGDITTWTNQDFERKREVVEELQSRLQRIGVPAQHPFWGCRLRSLLPTAQLALTERLQATSDALQNLMGFSSALAKELVVEEQSLLSNLPILLDNAKLAVGAPDISKLDLRSDQWRLHFDKIQGLLDIGLQYQELHSRYDPYLLPLTWTKDLTRTRTVLDTTGRSFLGRLFAPSYRRAKRQIASICVGDPPRTHETQMEVIDAIEREQKLKHSMDSIDPDAVAALGSHWSGYNTDWGYIAPSVRWSLELHDRIQLGQVLAHMPTILANQLVDPEWKIHLDKLIHDLDLAISTYQAQVDALQSAIDFDQDVRFGQRDGLLALPFRQQQQELDLWNRELARIQDIVGLNAGIQAALAEGLHSVVEVAAHHLEASESLTHWFERAWYESIVESAFSRRPPLSEAEGHVQETRIERFKTLDQQSLNHNLARVKAMHWVGPARLHDLPHRLIRDRSDIEPDESDDRKLQKQLRLLRNEIAKKSRHKPLRQLIQQAGEVIQQIKPVFMMSPLSIAAYLPPGVVKFDLVVFDEASQVRPADALGALLRADKAVVVGDSRQLPPTRFFDRALQSDEVDDYDDDDSVVGMESILGLFNARGAPSKRLRWHYRSRHESLIAVSNREFYENNLVVFPSPDSGRAATGLRFHHLPDASFDRGRSATNQREAEAVARAVMEHAASRPDLSLGVAAFSSSQASAIEDRLETLRSEDLSYETFFASHPDEPFFVKNLENVQGDERDVIFISIGYGRDESGIVRMNFGPLNNDGGERRLNVLITRAKHQCHVFTNLRADDIDLGRTNAAGVRALKTFLAYAETGIMPVDERRPNARVVDSPFQRAVASHLRDRGYEVHDEVTSAGYFVDMAIVDPERPGRYILGIECDGASYHSARSARDRDRLREQVLRGLGWELYRVWSTDWFRNPERELQRAVDAIERAKQNAVTNGAGEH